MREIYRRLPSAEASEWNEADVNFLLENRFSSSSSSPFITLAKSDDGRSLRAIAHVRAAPRGNTESFFLDELASRSVDKEWH